MQTRTFGRLGWPVSAIGFGGWAIGGSWGPQRDEDSLAALRRALDLGCTFIDTAAGYGGGRSERLIGQVLKERGLQGGGNGRIRVATKIPPADGHWPPLGHERVEDRYPEAYLRTQLEERLRNLNAETIDLLQLHTWNRAWNRDPAPLRVLAKLRQEGKLLGIGISTPEHDQNALVDLMRAGLLDSVQVIYNIFEQTPADEFLPVAREHGVGVIVRVVFDEGSLTGKFTPATTFPEGDFRRSYFRGDRIARVIERVDGIRATVERFAPGRPVNLPSVAIRFVLAHPAVSTVIPGIRTVAQAEANAAVADEPPLAADLMVALRERFWNRGFWYGG